MPYLSLQLTLLHPLWHGSGDWPPSPFRVFQAMVAGAFGGRWAGAAPDQQEQRLRAFRWLERQNAPVLAVPAHLPWNALKTYVPNNDLDSVGGDPGRVDEIRAEKIITPIRLDSSQSFLYVWHFHDGEAEAAVVCQLAERLHTFGRGVDPAWARAEVVDCESAEAALLAHGSVARPLGNSGGNRLRCPQEGSLDSLLLRYKATTSRLQADKSSKTVLFRQPPKAVYQQITYNREPNRYLFDMRRPDDISRFAPVPQELISPSRRQYERER